jgi:diacylglycerol kinase
LIPEKDLKVKYVKDVAAGAVLVASIFSIIIGLMVFLPYL